MMIKDKLKMIVLMCLVTSAALIVSSCSKDNDANSNKIQLLSFGPSGVEHGDDISFIGTGLDKVTSIIMPVGIEVSASQFKTQTSTLIVLTVPMESMEGPVTLKTPQGDIVSKTSFGSDYKISVATVTDEARPGADITITGDYLNYVKQITFSDAKVVTTFKNQSKTQLIVTIPMDAQSGRITLSNGKPTPQLVDHDGLIVTVPTVTSFTPASIKHLENITFTGTDLDLITSINFTGNKSTSTFVSQTPTQIVAAVPVGAVNGKITLVQVSPISIVTSSDLTIILPKGTSLSPKPAIPGTDNITINGTDLDMIASLTLASDTDPITITNFTTKTATQLVFALPTGAKSGPIGYKTVQGYENTLGGVSISVPTAGPPPLDYYIYDDQYENDWSNWGGWGWTTKDLSNAEQVLVGNTAIKMVFNDQYGAIQIGAPATNVFSGYTKLSFQVYAEVAQDLIVQLNNDSDHYLSVPQGWSLVEISISDLAGNTSVSELRIKNNNANLPTTLYFDEIGLKY